MEIKELMESVLKTHLDDNDVQYIKEYWRAFYEAPQEYEGDRVCDMVLEDLNKQANPDFNKNEKIGGIKQMDLEYGLIGVSDLNLKHYVPDDTLAWGKIGETPLYIRKLVYREIPGHIDTTTASVKDFARNARGIICVLIREMDSDASVAYVFNANEVVDDIKVAELIPDNFTYWGMVSLETTDEVPERALLALASDVYVPMNKGTNGRLMPIMWNNEVSSDEAGICISAVDEVLVSDGAFSIDALDNIMGYLKSKLPSVDLQQSRNNRYTNVVIDTQGTDSFYVGYNRNHLAYNGNVSNLRSCMPIVLRMLWRVCDSIESTNILKYISTSMSDDELVIRLAGAKKVDDSVPVEETTSEKKKSGVGIPSGRGRVGVDMLDAARASAGVGY